MSALRTALRPALTPALGSARLGVSRYFTPQDAVAQSYVNFPQGIQAAGDFDFSVDVSYIFSATFACIASFDNVFVSVLGSNSGKLGGLTIRGSGFGANFDSTSGGIFDERLSRFILSRRGTQWIASVNGIEFMNVQRNSGTIELRALGRNLSSLGQPDNYDGIISNASISALGLGLVSTPINRYYTPQNNIVLDESGNGNNGTFVNIAAGRSKYYQQRADGNFVDLQGNVLEAAY